MPGPGRARRLLPNGRPSLNKKKKKKERFYLTILSFFNLFFVFNHGLRCAGGVLAQAAARGLIPFRHSSLVSARHPSEFCCLPVGCAECRQMWLSQLKF